jgi:phage-related protein
MYRTASGVEPVREFIAQLSDEDAAEIAAALKEVEAEGLIAARHLRGDIYELRADGPTQTFRILFAAEGRYKQVFLALTGFSKKTQKTPVHEIALAEKRLADWRQRARR